MRGKRPKLRGRALADLSEMKTELKNKSQSFNTLMGSKEIIFI